MKRKIDFRQVALCLTLCFLTVVFCSTALPMKEAAVYDSVIRLHILANSDSDYDQGVKLAVRDAILEANCFEGANDMEAATQKAEAAARAAVDTANRYLAERGVPYRASYLWGKEVYPTREYGEVRLPSGEYLSLRIVLGEGEGANWWCVLFPPLCTGAASDSLDIENGEVFSTEQGRYVFRFKLLEWFSR